MDNVNKSSDLQLDAEEPRAPRREGGAESRGAVRLRRPERGQVAWVAQCPDDLVSPTHPVRRIAAVVEHLDVSGFCEAIKARKGVAGRDATDPKLLVALWLYACVRGIGLARELARQCEDSLAFRWLCGGVTVNHRLLSDFRTAHGEALDALFTQVIASLVDKGVVKVSRISQDGLRVRVGAGASSFRGEERLQELLAQAQQHVEELRRQLEGPEGAGLTARQRAAREARERAALAGGDRAVAGSEEAARGDGKTGGGRTAGKEGAGTQAAGEHHGCGGAGDEDGQRRI